MTIETTMMSGAGNLFCVLDNSKYGLSLEDGKHLAPVLCSGAMEGLSETEGLMLISSGNSPHAFVMEFFNPDGSHGAMCGNGGRCAARFALDHNLVEANDKQEMTFTNAGTGYTATLVGNDVRIGFAPPLQFIPHVVVGTDNGIVEGSYVDVGSDHFVVQTDKIPVQQDEFLIEFWGPLLRHHSHFPRGANINFFAVKDGVVHLRTFERGVEAETGACGTGAMSTALVGVHNHMVSFPVTVIPTSRKQLIIDADVNDSGTIEQVYLQGPAITLSKHDVNIEFLEPEA